MGVIVNDGENSKIRNFLENHPEYSYVETEPLDVYSSVLPYINQFSLLIAQKKIYPKFDKFIESRNDLSFSPETIEIYHLVPKFWGKELKVSKILDRGSHSLVWRDSYCAKSEWDDKIPSYFPTPFIICID